MTPAQLIFLALVRHVVTFVGGSLAMQGAMTNGEVETAVGAIMSLASIAWAVYSRHKRNKEHPHGG